VRWFRDMLYYGTGGFWVLATIILVGCAIAGSIFSLRCEVKRLADVLERTHCSCKVEERADDFLMH
jgi:hypothetical protein